MSRLEWARVVEQAQALVESHAEPVTLRQVFYRLVATGAIPNRVSAYKRLSAVTAEARRQGRFPELADHGRRIARWRSPTPPTPRRGCAGCTGATAPPGSPPPSTSGWRKTRWSPSSPPGTTSAGCR
ncbi:hypothetical protein ACWGPQ_22065 [Saccharomonospora azurea]